MTIDEIKNTIIQGDCLEVMRKMPADSVDTVLCDPPYELNFMNKGWDNKGVAFKKETWEEVLRIAKPGATLMAFGGTRTYHRLACAIEDAGWVIKDCVMYLYGSGFPKATDISKQLDKRVGGKEAKQWNGWKSHGLKPAYEPIIVAMKPNEGSYAENALRWKVAGLNIEGGRIGTEEISAHGGGQNKEGRKYGGGQGIPKVKKGEYEHQGRFPANLILNSESAKLLDEQSGKGGSGKMKIGSFRHKAPENLYQLGTTKKEGALQNAPDDYGDMGGASRFFYTAKASKSERNLGCEGLEKKDTQEYGSIRQERGSGYEKASKHTNNHPCVKPLSLMEYLCELTKTPTGGIVLDPFAGSGTTALACIKTKRDFIMIEKEFEYVEISRARINAQQKPLL